MSDTRAPDDDLPPLPSSVNSEAISRLPFSFVISDSSLPDNPIVFVNRAFLETGCRR